MMRIRSFALISLLGLYLSLACSSLFAVGHPGGSFATPDNGGSFYVSFKHVDNTNPNDFPFGFYEMSSTHCIVSAVTSCVTDCVGLVQQAASTLATLPTSDIVVNSLVFNTVGVPLVDTTSNFCAVLDGNYNIWAIDRDLPALSSITTANSVSRIIPCESSDIFNPQTGCQQPPRHQIGIEDGFMKLDTTDGFAPHEDYCSETAHNGRMVFDDVNDRLYICTATGWIYK